MRRQAYDLTFQDLQSHPIWEYCLGEEGTKNQDEATVRPRNDQNFDRAVRSAIRTTMIKTEFVSRSGKIYLGFCSPAVENDLSSMQPVIITETGQVAFYHGVLKPSNEEISNYYQRLNISPEDLFPLRFQCLIIMVGRIWTRKPAKIS